MTATPCDDCVQIFIMTRSLSSNIYIVWCALLFISIAHCAVTDYYYYSRHRRIRSVPLMKIAYHFDNP